MYLSPPAQTTSPFPSQATAHKPHVPFSYPPHIKTRPAMCQHTVPTVQCASYPLWICSRAPTGCLKPQVVLALYILCFFPYILIYNEI
jgi:hypothetical protein